MKLVSILLALAFAAPAATPDFTGAWRLLGSSGANAPVAFRFTVDQAGGALRFQAQWEEPHNGQYALTLLGIITPELRISTSNQPDLNQVGPFVFRSRSRWEANRLITDWNTTPYLGQSFRGTWTRYLSADGSEMTIEIAAVSSAGKHSAAKLIFRRQPPTPRAGSN